jgi:hypothetical protein
MTQGRHACRSGQRCTPQSLAEAIYCAVHHSDLELEAIAVAMGIRPGYLKDAANPDRNDTQFQVRWLVPLAQVTGNLAIVQWIGAELRCAIVPLPPVEARQDALYSTFAAAVGEIGQDSEAIRRVLDDGEVTEAEVHELVRELGDTMTALAAVQAAALARLPEKGAAIRMTLPASTSTRRRA